MKSRLPHPVTTLLCIFAVASFATAEAPKIGDVAPEWKQLSGTDGTLHSSADLADMDAVIVCFTCNTCPYSIDYEDRLISLQQKYLDAQAKVRIVAINSNAVAVDDLDAMKRRANEKKYNFAYIKDESQDVARAFDAIYTPEFYVLNHERKIVYRGAMDDSTKAETVMVNYVECAVDAALQGELPEITAAGARGCRIRFKRKRR